ncbi:hypothetical protein ACP4OV_017583 [Aristida adscensionis]
MEIKKENPALPASAATVPPPLPPLEGVKETTALPPPASAFGSTDLHPPPPPPPPPPMEITEVDPMLFDSISTGPLPPPPLAPATSPSPIPPCTHLQQLPPPKGTGEAKTTDTNAALLAAAASPSPVAASSDLLAQEAAAAGALNPKPKPKPDFSTPIRVVTAPLRTAATPTPATGRAMFSLLTELEHLKTALAMIGEGFGKVLSSCGVENGDAKKKDDNSSSKEGDEKKNKGTKQKKTGIIVAAPGLLSNASATLTGLNQIIIGSKESAIVVAKMIWELPSFVKTTAKSSVKMIRDIRCTVPSLRSTKSELNPATASAGRMGANRQSLSSLLNQQLLARAVNRSILVNDGNGLWRTAPGSLHGTRIIACRADLTDAIRHYRDGTEMKFLEVDRNTVSFEKAYLLWSDLQGDNLGCLVKTDSILREMAIQAAALLEEQKIVEEELAKAEECANDLRICSSVLRKKLASVPRSDD